MPGRFFLHRRLIAQEYASCGITPAQLETGAVIITGEAARKENAAIVSEQLSGFAGDFVVETAGPDLESVIAGQGSGAQRFSRETGCDPCAPSEENKKAQNKGSLCFGLYCQSIIPCCMKIFIFIYYSRYC